MLAGVCKLPLVISWGLARMGGSVGLDEDCNQVHSLSVVLVMVAHMQSTVAMYCLQEDTAIFSFSW